MTEEISDPIVGLHYALSGYVARNGIIPSVLDGPATFTHIMDNRPKEARFAIAQIVRLRKVVGKWGAPDTYEHEDAPSGPYVVWDLHDDQLTRGMRTAPSGLIMPPPPLWMNESEDGMLMKAMMFFDSHP